MERRVFHQARLSHLHEVQNQGQGPKVQDLPWSWGAGSAPEQGTYSSPPLEAARMCLPQSTLTPIPASLDLSTDQE